MLSGQFTTKLIRLGFTIYGHRYRDGVLSIHSSPDVLGSITVIPASILNSEGDPRTSGSRLTAYRIMASS